MYIRDAQSSLLRTRCSRPVGATDSDSLPPSLVSVSLPLESLCQSEL